MMIIAIMARLVRFHNVQTPWHPCDEDRERRILTHMCMPLLYYRYEDEALDVCDVEPVR